MIKKAISDSIQVKQQILQDIELQKDIETVVAIIVFSLRSGGKIHFCGNGGSAADAQHLAAELSGRFYLDRPPLNAEALHCNSSYLTAVANDYGFESVFARLLQGTAKKGDVLVAISTSGNSQNMVNACQVAKELGVKVVSLTGASGGKLKTLSDVLLNVPSEDTPRIQECHIMLGHIICELVEKEMFTK